MTYADKLKAHKKLAAAARLQSATLAALGIALDHAGRYDYAAVDPAVQDAFRAGDSEDSIRAVICDRFAFAAVTDSIQAARDGGKARRAREDADARDQECRDRKREKDIAELRRITPGAARTTLRRVTTDDAAVHGSQYLGREGEWAEMPA